MHLLVLGAFWHETLLHVEVSAARVLMHLMALGAF